jgi:hypothetical protein
MRLEGPENGYSRQAPAHVPELVLVRTGDEIRAWCQWSYEPRGPGTPRVQPKELALFGCAEWQSMARPRAQELLASLLRKDGLATASANRPRINVEREVWTRFGKVTLSRHLSRSLPFASIAGLLARHTLSVSRPHDQWHFLRTRARLHPGRRGHTDPGAAARSAACAGAAPARGTFTPPRCCRVARFSSRAGSTADYLRASA